VEPVIILLALAAGLAFRAIGYPPLPGYLLAGFVSHALGVGEILVIGQIADLGITLLLFTIGLKLNLKELAAPQVWAVTLLQMVIAVPLTTLLIIVSGILFPLLALENTASAWALALALSFSSTVFAVKMFEDRGETVSLHASIAIGVLVIQDIIAVMFLVLSSETPPGIAALGLLALPLLRPVLLYLLRSAGHGELVLLFGIALALGTAELFELAHLKGGLGALLMGVILGSAEKSKELYSSMIGLKDLFLIGFFIQIGYYGLPSAEMMLVAVALGFLIFLRPMIYYLLFVAFRLRARTALIASLALFTYSEFGLIVAAIATSAGLLPAEWLTTLALGVSISFFLATPFNAKVHDIYHRYCHWLQKFERHNRLPSEVSADLGDADIVVLGMGRVGRGVYEYLAKAKGDNAIIGVEENLEKVRQHRVDGFNCVHGDATDNDFWMNAEVERRRLIIVNLSNHSENLTVVRLAKQFNFSHTLAVVSRYPDEQAELEAMGCISFNLYGEAGHGFAEHVLSRMATGSV
jgi:predicted Kef-type K+ transport protein